jgi:hypothetical protein
MVRFNITRVADRVILDFLFFMHKAKEKAKNDTSQANKSHQIQ